MTKTSGLQTKSLMCQIHTLGANNRCYLWAKYEVRLYEADDSKTTVNVCDPHAEMLGAEYPDNIEILKDFTNTWRYRYTMRMIRSMSAVQKDFKTAINNVIDQDAELVITKKGKSKVVVIGIDRYNEMKWALVEISGQDSKEESTEPKDIPFVPGGIVHPSTVIVLGDKDEVLKEFKKND